MYTIIPIVLPETSSIFYRCNCKFGDEPFYCERCKLGAIEIDADKKSDDLISNIFIKLRGGA